MDEKALLDWKEANEIPLIVCAAISSLTMVQTN
jgi:hypothetical protein